MIFFPPWFPFVVNWNQMPSIGLGGWWIETFDIMFASMFWNVGGFFLLREEMALQSGISLLLFGREFCFFVWQFDSSLLWILQFRSENSLMQRTDWPQTKIGNLTWTSVLHCILLSKRMKTTCFSSTLTSVLTSWKVPSISFLNTTT